MMTLDEAIVHAKDKAFQMCLSKDAEKRSCGQEHLQLARWLQELKDYKSRDVWRKSRTLEYPI